MACALRGVPGPRPSRLYIIYIGRHRNYFGKTDRKNVGKACFTPMFYINHFLSKSAARRGRSCAGSTSAKSADRRGRSCAGPQIMTQPLKNMSNIVCAGPQIMSQPLKNMSNIVCGPAQDRPLRSGRLGWKQLSAFGTWEIIYYGKLSWAVFSSQGALSLYLRDILASKLAVYPVGRDSPLQGQSLPMTKIAKA